MKLKIIKEKLVVFPNMVYSNIKKDLPEYPKNLAYDNLEDEDAYYWMNYGTKPPYKKNPNYRYNR